MKTDQNASHSKQPIQQSSPIGYSVMDTNESLLKEGGALRTQVLSAKMITHIGYWNVRILLESSKLPQVIKEMEAYKFNIMGLSEVCWIDSSDFSSGHKTSGCQDNIHHDSIALILDKQAFCVLEKLTPVNKHLLTERFCDDSCQSHCYSMLCPTQWPW